MILQMMLHFDEFEDETVFLMILRMLLDFDDFEDDAVI